MKTITGTTVIALALFTLSFLTETARGEEFKRTTDRRFDVDKNATLSVKNKFGEVHCQVWSENAISIKVEIIVDAASQEKADKVLDRISVNIAGDRNQVSAATDVGNMSFNNVEFSIDYYIMMPRSINLNVDHSFGELYLEDVDGSTKINLEYGEMKVRALNGLKSDITMKFSEGSIDYFKDGKINIEYGELSVTGANNLEVRSRFSELDLEKFEAIHLDSQYDEVTLGSTGNLDITGRFSEIEVDRLNGNFVIDTEYGEIDVNYIYSGFTEGVLNASFSEVSLAFDPAVSFKVDARMEFCSLDYPSSNTSVSHQEENYVNNLYHGVIGSNKSATASLTIKSKNGDVDISF